MNITAPYPMRHLGETRGCSDQDYDLIHELNRRLEALWHCDQKIANAEGNKNLQEFWRVLKRQDEECVERLKHYVKEQVKSGCF